MPTWQFNKWDFLCFEIAYSWLPAWNNCQAPANPEQKNDFINSKLIKKSRKSFTWTVRVLSNQNFLFSLFSVEGEELWAFSPRNHISRVGVKAERMENSSYKYTHLKIPSNSFDKTKIYSFLKIILHWVRSVPAVCTRSKGRDVDGMAAKLVRNFIFCRKTLSAEL